MNGPALLDQHAHGDGPLQRAPAGAKLLTLVAFLAIIALLRPSPALYGTAALVLAAATVISRVPVPFLLRKLLFLEPFVLGVALMTLFQPDGGARFLVTITRSTLCLYGSLLVASTTPFSGLLDALRAARLPGILVLTIALTYRYLFVLVDEALRMRRARAARSLRGGRLPEWRALSSVVAHLFLRVSERAERLHAAMSARGWQP